MWSVGSNRTCGEGKEIYRGKGYSKCAESNHLQSSYLADPSKPHPPSTPTHPASSAACFSHCTATSFAQNQTSQSPSHKPRSSPPPSQPSEPPRQPPSPLYPSASLSSATPSTQTQPPPMPASLPQPPSNIAHVSLAAPAATSPQRAAPPALWRRRRRNIQNKSAQIQSRRAVGLSASVRPRQGC